SGSPPDASTDWMCRLKNRLSSILLPIRSPGCVCGTPLLRKYPPACQAGFRWLPGVSTARSSRLSFHPSHFPASRMSAHACDKKHALFPSASAHPFQTHLLRLPALHQTASQLPAQTPKSVLLVSFSFFPPDHFDVMPSL